MRLLGRLAVCLVLGMAALASRAQEPVFTTVCSVWKEPAAFAGKLVNLRATVIIGFESSSLFEPDKSCDRRIWFQFAREKTDDSKNFDDRDALLQRQQPVFLKKDEGLQKFEAALRARVYSRTENAGCMGCSLYIVTATMVGRIDYAGEDESGFGHMNGAMLRFVMASVSDISTVEKGYNWEEWSRTPVRFAHGTIQGKVTDSTGHPLHSAPVEAVPVQGQIPVVNPQTSTDEDGRFSINVKPGRYLVVVNRTSPATEAAPMEETFYPSADQRKQAQIVSVADGQTVNGIDVRPLKTLSEKHLRVLVVWPDGTPVEEANVALREAAKPWAIAGMNSGGVSHTAKDGWVTLLAYAGESYRLDADIYKEIGSLPYCGDVFLLPLNFRDGLTVKMVLRRQSESCHSQSDEAPKPLPADAVSQ